MILRRLHLLSLLAVAALCLPAVGAAQDSPLFQGTTADVWLIDATTGQVTGYDKGMWVNSFIASEYVGIDLGPDFALLINKLPASSVTMSPGQPAISLVGIGDAALGIGAGGGGGHRDLTLAPAGGDYVDTIAVVIGVSGAVLAQGDHRLTWSAVETTSQTTVVNGSKVLPRNSGGSGENGYYNETFYLVNTGNYAVSATVRGAGADTSVGETYNLTIAPGKERRDTDGDGIPDVVEADMGLNPFEDDWTADKDGNGWSEFDEWLRRYCLDPNTLQPLDGAAECLDANGLPLDTDRDDWTDFDEILRGTNHLDPEPAIVAQKAAPPANQKLDAGGVIALGPTQVFDAQFCTDGSTFYFDLDFEAEADDSILNDVIVGIGADAQPFAVGAERIRVNFDESGNISRGVDPIVQNTPSATVTPPDRWLDGLIADFTIESTGQWLWHVYGSVPVGTEPFIPGDTIFQVGIRSGVSGNYYNGGYVISGNTADCLGGPLPPPPEPILSEYESKQRLRFKDFPAANRLYEVEHLVSEGTGLLSVPPLANIVLEQQSAGANQGAYEGIVVQSITATQDNIAGVDFRVAAGGEGVEDIILNIWADSLRDGTLLLSQKIEDVELDGDPDRPIIVRFEPVAVQPGQPVFLEFRKKTAGLVTTGADTLGGGGVVEIKGVAAAGTSDLVLDVYYDANFANGIGGTRAGMQWWTIAAAGVDGSLAYDATTLLRDDDITAAGLVPADVSPRRRMTTLANALGGNQLPELRLPAGNSLVVSAVHRHHVPDQDGWRAPSDYSRIYKNWLPRSDDVTPQTMLAEMGEGAWTTPEEWRREFIAYLVPRLVVPVGITLDEASTLRVATVEAALSEEARIDGSGGLQLLNGIFQPGQPIYSYQPGQPVFGDLLSHQSPYVNDWETNLERLSVDSFNLDQSYAEVTAALGPGMPLEPLGQWLRERFYAGIPGTSSDKYMAQQVLRSFPDVCFVRAESVADLQANVDGWNEFLNQCPVWFDETGLDQRLVEDRNRCYLVRMNLLPGAASEVASDATLLDLLADSDADGSINGSEVEVPVQQLTLPWMFDSDGDGIADAVDQCPVDEYNDCSANPIRPGVTLDADFAVYEPEVGADFALVSVHLGRIYDVPVTVCYEAFVDVGDTATGDVDFQLATGCVVIEPGQLSALIAVPINADGEIDAGETFTVRITSITNGEIGDDGIVVVTINDPIPDGNDVPIFTSATTANAVDGNTATGYTATAIDADGDTLTFSISGGLDQAAFGIDPVSGVLSFVSAPDFNAPADADGNNDYEVQLMVDDGNLGTDTLDLVVSVVESVPVFRVTYPTPNANLGGGVTSTIVTGSVTDAAGGQVDPAAFSNIQVNGVAASIDVSDPTHWRWSVRVPVSEGHNVLSISRELPDATVIESDQLLENEPANFGFGEIALDIANGRAFVIDGFADGVLSVDLSTGNRMVISGPGVGTGLNFNSPRGIIIDAPNNRVLVGDSGRDALTAVDLATGNRTDISSSSVGTGILLDGPNAIAADFANNRVYVAAWVNDNVIEVDLTTGDRTELSGAGIGNGPTLAGVQGITVDSANNRVLVSDTGLDAIVAIDMTNGDRTILSDDATGSGPSVSPLDSTLDSTNNRLLVVDQVYGLFAIDLTSGDRTVLADPAADYGRNASRIQSVAFDAATDTAYVPDSYLDVIFSFNLSNGTRDLLTDSMVGSGAPGTGSWGHQGIVVDPDANRLLVTNNSKGGAVIAIDLASADRTVLSGNSRGAGPLTYSPQKIVIDPINNRAMFTDYSTARALYAVDLDSGDRAVISDAATGTGPNFDVPSDVAVDSMNSRATILDQGLSAVVDVNLSTGDRSILSGTATGNGPMWVYPRGIDADFDDNVAYVSEFTTPNYDGIFYAVDMVTGDRTIIADNAGVGTGPDLVLVEDFKLSIDGNSILYMQRQFAGGITALMKLDVATGDRTVLSGNGMGSGIDFSAPYHLAWDEPNNRAFVYDIGVTGIIVINLTTGERALASK